MKKKSEECHRKEQALWLQSFCKISFPDSTSFKLKVLLAECVTLESHEKKTVECHRKEQRSPFSEFSFELILLYTTMILQNTIPRFNLLQIESFDSGVCDFRELRIKICWMSQHGTEKSIYRVIFRIGFGIMPAMIMKNTISRFNFSRIKSFDSSMCYIGKPRD